MSLVFRIILAAQLLRLPEASSCEEWEYKTNGQCCPTCGTGYRVQEHCTATSSRSCVPCTNRTYMDHPNGLVKCFRCLVCDKGANLRVKEECTYQRNTICACRPGFFCSNHTEKSCERCKKHTVAPPGHRVTEPGTENSDTKFAPCPPRTFSMANMSSSCDPWTICSKLGMIEVQAGSPTSDAVCGPPASPVPVAFIVVPLVLAAVAVACIALVAMCIKRRNAGEGPVGEKKEEPNGDYLPVPESDHRLVVPMQETMQCPGEPTYATPHVSIRFG